MFWLGVGFNVLIGSRFQCFGWSWYNVSVGSWYNVSVGSKFHCFG